MTKTRKVRLLLDSTVRCLFHIISIVFSYKTYRRISLAYDFLYSHWIAVSLSHAGKGFVAHHPVTIVGEKNISIGEMSVIGKYGVITAWDNYDGMIFEPAITIGERCDLGEYIHISCCNKIDIGNDVLTGRWITISDNSHGQSTIDEQDIAPVNRPIYSKGPIRIEDKVWIGDKVTILGGVTIGQGAVIAANSVITHDIPPHTVVAGSPAKVIKNIN